MHIQSINNSSNVSSKGLYYAKANALVNKSVRNMAKEGVSVSETGIKYVEDKAIPQIIKDAVENNKYIQDVANKYDTFVSYFRNKGILTRAHISQLILEWRDGAQGNLQQKVALSNLREKTVEEADKTLAKNIENLYF